MWLRLRTLSGPAGRNSYERGALLTTRALHPCSRVNAGGGCRAPPSAREAAPKTAPDRRRPINRAESCDVLFVPHPAVDALGLDEAQDRSDIRIVAWRGGEIRGGLQYGKERRVAADGAPALDDVKGSRTASENSVALGELTGHLICGIVVFASDRICVMAQLIRVIWRLDFNVSYAYLDSLGTALRILVETIPGFLPTLSEGMGNRSFLGERRRKGEYTTISVEPAALVGSMEWTEGVDLARVFNQENFRNCDKIAKAILAHSKVTLVNRAGIRFYFFVRQPGFLEDNSLHEMFIPSAVLSKSKRTLGPPSDVGVVVEGIRKDNLSYRANFGPGAFKNFNLSMTPQPNISITEEQYKGLFGNYSIFCDLDIYENNFMLVEGSMGENET
jgi:hypothetical protein